MTRGLVALRFWGDPRVSAEALAEALSGARPPMVVDVRGADEFAVSHLRGALSAPLDGVEAALAGVDRGRALVAVCSVGYRSGAAARRLRAAGFRDVRNLDGGLFGWVNGGRTLESGGAATRAVHPYSALWATLIRAPARAERGALTRGGARPARARPGAAAAPPRR
ncbi:MAG: rhodanese-like domain-containing protein [Polyangiales bacterium]